MKQKQQALEQNLQKGRENEGKYLKMEGQFCGPEERIANRKKENKTCLLYKKKL